MESLTELLKLIVKNGYSDLHLVSGKPPQARRDGELISLEGGPLTPEAIEKMSGELISPDLKKKFREERELDCAIQLPGGPRFRFNLYWEKGAPAIAIRPIATQIPTPEELGLPDVVLELAKRPRGLVLITGPTGSGKSTTLASLIDQINKERAAHIITLEDPIEFVHTHKKATVSQREIGQDSHSFQESLKHVLRQDPDVILIGEMRDLETISAAITSAETGHLVFATLHTNSAVQTINRIIDVFPPHQQPQIRTQLSFILEGILSQRLLPKSGGGRVMALEILVPTPAIRNLIREDKLHQIHAQMLMGQTGTRMVLMDQALADLVQKKIVSYEEALSHCNDPDEFKKMIGPPEGMKRPQILRS